MSYYCTYLREKKREKTSKNATVRDSSMIVKLI
jgi:hypothetical protein